MSSIYDVARELLSDSGNVMSDTSYEVTRSSPDRETSRILCRAYVILIKVWPRTPGPDDGETADRSEAWGSPCSM